MTVLVGGKLRPCLQESLIIGDSFGGRKIEALFTRRPSFPRVRVIPKRVYKHAKQLNPGARVSLVPGFPCLSNREETRVLGLTFSLVHASLGITDLPG